MRFPTLGQRSQRNLCTHMRHFERHTLSNYMYEKSKHGSNLIYNTLGARGLKTPCLHVYKISMNYTLYNITCSYVEGICK